MKTFTPHPSHVMGEERSEIRAPAGTPRFYGVRECVNCEAEEIEHPAGHFWDEELEHPCWAAPEEEGG